jgi:hypothetical protein
MAKSGKIYRIGSRDQHYLMPKKGRKLNNENTLLLSFCVIAMLTILLIAVPLNEIFALAINHNVQRVLLQGYKPIAIQNQTSGSNKSTSQGVLDIITNKANLMQSRTYVAGISNISIGDKQHIIVSVADANSSLVIAGANVSTEMVNSTNFKQVLGSGHTNNFGSYEYVYTIGQSTRPGIYSVIANTSAEGYQPSSGSFQFQVKPQSLPEKIRLTTSNNNCLHFKEGYPCGSWVLFINDLPLMLDIKSIDDRGKITNGSLAGKAISNGTWNPISKRISFIESIPGAGDNSIAYQFTGFHYNLNGKILLSGSAVPLGVSPQQAAKEEFGWIATFFGTPVLQSESDSATRNKTTEYIDPDYQYG